MMIFHKISFFGMILEYFSAKDNIIIMKPIIKLVLLFIIPLTMVSMAQAQVSDKVVKAISNGSANGVAKYFDSSVDITILNTSNSYSKSQAEEVLKDFFFKNSVSGFKLMHNIDSRGGDSSSIIGTLTAGGESFRVYVLLNSASSKNAIIQELTIRQR